MAPRVAIFGGAFDPPHLGHQAVCLYLLSIEAVDQVWWVPTAVHAFTKHMAPYEDRLAMCALAARHFGEATVRVSDVERSLPQPCYTIHTVEHLRASYPEVSFALAVGSDNLAELHRWHEHQRLRATIPLLVVPRPGHPADVEDAPALLPDISSRAIRDALVRGVSVEAWLDRAVADHIAARGLYT